MEGWREGRLRFSRKCRLRHISKGKKVRREKQNMRDCLRGPIWERRGHGNHDNLVENGRWKWK